MEMLQQLWMPILLSAAAVWVASAVAWMFVGHHRKDFDKLPNEQAFLDFVRSQSIPPGNYGYPYFGDADCHSPENKAKWEKGPLGTIGVWGLTGMGRKMLLTFLVYLAVSVLIGYLGSVALHKGESFAKVFRILGTAGVLAYCFANIPNGIWFNSKPRALVMSVIDGVVYGLATGAIFAWRWPGLTD